MQKAGAMHNPRDQRKRAGKKRMDSDPSRPYGRLTDDEYRHRYQDLPNRHFAKEVLEDSLVVLKRKLAFLNASLSQPGVNRSLVRTQRRLVIRELRHRGHWHHLRHATVTNACEVTV